MAQKLFPIFADPNVPSLFDGLDVSLSAGQITAVNGTDNFTMTASTLTANSESATWADIVDLVVNPAPAPTLQSVLNSGNSASTADAGTASISFISSPLGSSHSAEAIAFTTETSPVISSSLALYGLSVVNDTLQTTLTSSSLSITGNNSEASTVSSSQHSIADAIYNAVLTPASLAINLVADPTDNVLMSVNELVYSSGTTGSTLNSVDHTFSTTSANAVYSATGAVITVNTGTATMNGDSLLMSNATDSSTLSASSLSLESGAITTTLSMGSLQMVDASATTSLTDGSLILMDVPNTSIATITHSSIAVGKDADYVEMTKDNLVLANSTVSTTITPASIGGGDATLNYSLASPTDANGQNALLTSSKSIRMTAEQNFAFSAGDDVVVYPRNAVITTSAGGSTDQYLSVIVNGIPYRISLLAQPTFPLRTISRINIGGGQNIFVQEPYIQWDYFTISFTVSGFSGATGSSNFEILSYPTNGFQPNVSYSVRKVFINANGAYSFSVQNLTPERYNALQFFQTSANAFTISSWTVNGVQQIAAPNPVPLVCPPA